MVLPDASRSGHVAFEAKPENLIGDRAYDSDPLDEELRRDGIEMIAPHRGLDGVDLRHPHHGGRASDAARHIRGAGAASAARQDDAEKVSIIVNGRKGLYDWSASRNAATWACDSRSFSA